MAISGIAATRPPVSIPMRSSVALASFSALAFSAPGGFSPLTTQRVSHALHSNRSQMSGRTRKQKGGIGSGRQY